MLDFKKVSKLNRESMEKTECIIIGRSVSFPVFGNRICFCKKD